MTDRGTRVRWTTAALVAPAAAAVFTGTTVWSAEHEPATASTTTSTTTSTTPAAAAPAAAAPSQPDPIVASLQAAVDANTVQVKRLRVTVASLEAQAAAIAKGTPAAAVRTSKTTTRSTSRTATNRTTAPRTTTRTSAPASKPAPAVRAPAAAPAPAPAPAPATQTTTGASGAVK
jgi:hypothetical protein